MNSKSILFLCVLSFLLSACAQFSQTSQNMFKGIQMSEGMSQEEIDEEAHGGQMRNIK